jgi:hypothetical protein
LLHNGSRALVNLAAEPRGVELGFRICAEEQAPTLQMFTPEILEPRDGAAVAAVDLSAFLRTPAARAMAPDGIADLTVGDLIHFLANEEGAVHRGVRPPTDRKYHVFLALMSIRHFGPEWQYSGAVHGCRVIAGIVLDGLADLRAQVLAETWPDDHDERLRGLEGRGVLHRPDGSVVYVDEGGRVAVR